MSIEPGHCECHIKMHALTSHGKSFLKLLSTKHWIQPRDALWPCLALLYPYLLLDFS
jgi:hypothetical protein